MSASLTVSLILAVFLGASGRLFLEYNLEHFLSDDLTTGTEAALLVCGISQAVPPLRLNVTKAARADAAHLGFGDPSDKKNQIQ